RHAVEVEFFHCVEGDPRFQRNLELLASAIAGNVALVARLLGGRGLAGQPEHCLFRAFDARGLGNHRAKSVALVLVNVHGPDRILCGEPGRSLCGHKYISDVELNTGVGEAAPGASGPLGGGEAVGCAGPRPDVTTSLSARALRQLMAAKAKAATGRWRPFP